MTRRGRRVDRWVDDLLHDRSPRGLRGADPEDLDALSAAIELRTATPGSGMPDPRFVENLHRRLARETQGEALPRPRLSRRGLLASGGVAAAAAAAGLLAGERLTGTGTPDRNLVPETASWIDVAALVDVPAGTARRFSTPSFEGFVVNHDGTTVEALSAACTHLGCILAYNARAARLDCPCHQTAFRLDGTVLFQSLPQSLPPLPRLQARVRAGRIEVYAV
ncbi:MAG TPA: Rieske (2Fe-2S) protein [Candidatus Dormibacteraeota bacterium]|nr:Rieske (2Fe-2S) protein [Candidatus Dormibacteraeota bacterium]